MRQPDFGSYIRLLRLKMGMTQKELADRLNITDKAVSKWERGLSYPDILLLPKISEALDVSVGDIINSLDDDGEPARLVKHYEMSSDLRAPLHIILGCTDLAEAYRDNAAKCSHYLEAIRVSGEYLLSALNKEECRNEHKLAGFEDYIRENVSGRNPSLQSDDFTGDVNVTAEDKAVDRED